MELKKGYFESKTHWIAIISPDKLDDKDKKKLAAMLKNATELTSFEGVPSPFADIQKTEEVFLYATHPKPKTES